MDTLNHLLRNAKAELTDSSLSATQNGFLLRFIAGGQLKVERDLGRAWPGSQVCLGKNIEAISYFTGP